MNFKTDQSFLEKITMGAIGTQAVIDELNGKGHQVIELERYCTSNKIWSTKIKRLRMPDLICLKCGKRIESRAKSNLEIKMSDTETNVERRWNVGLRREDMVAFIRCYRDNEGCKTEGVVNLFSVGVMEDAEGRSKLGAPKSPGEGSERDRNWPCYVPKKRGIVEEIIDDGENHKIRLRYDSGKAYTYNCKDKEHYCVQGERFGEHTSIIAGVVSGKGNNDCVGDVYDFSQDMRSELPEIRYAGVKAVGFLPRKDETVEMLYEIIRSEDDTRIKLEAYASLVRMNEDVWEEFKEYAHAIDDEQYKMEFILILGELTDYENSRTILYEIMGDDAFSSEMKAAALWGVGVSEENIAKVLWKCFSAEKPISRHAITLMETNMRDNYTQEIARCIEDEHKGAICFRILTNAENIDKEFIVEEFISTNDEMKSKWLGLIIGFSGRDKYKCIVDNKIESAYVRHQLEIMWDYIEAKLSSDDISEIDFLRLQTI